MKIKNNKTATINMKAIAVRISNFRLKDHNENKN